MRVFLTGFMASGKSTVGRCLARRLGLRFTDLDDEIVQSAGMSVREIFARGGESAFRRLETEALERVAATGGTVVATGGGTITVEANRDIIRRAGISVWINPPFDALVERMGGAERIDRPLFRSETEALELFRRRLPAYRQADLRVDVGRAEEPEAVASRITLLLGEAGCAT